MLMGLYPAGCYCFGEDPSEYSAAAPGLEPAVIDLSAAATEHFGPILEAYPHEGNDDDDEVSGAMDSSWLPPIAVEALDAECVAKVADAWAHCADDLRRRAKHFVTRAEAGVPCRLVDARTHSATPARYTLDPSTAVFCVDELNGADSLRRRCHLADVQNIWVCSDNQLACRALGNAVQSGSADAELACMALIDVPEGPIGIVERSAEAREEFLDCMAVLVATQRLRRAPEVACCGVPGRLPPPEARLRPAGRSLRSMYLSGPICPWLARVGEGLISPDAPLPPLPSLEGGSCGELSQQMRARRAERKYDSL
mmetsp:Transcript_41391/g.81792  ORF Transcript_41391/g.81792 Transcript_41391/m.81792 type:complete len:312 (+) Transcript_41391:169-1104(+)